MPEIPQDLKTQEFEILKALGWKFLDSGYLDWIDPRLDRHHDPPNLSDPGQFWPIFEAWYRDNQDRVIFHFETKQTGLDKYHYWAQYFVPSYQQDFYGETFTAAAFKAFYAALVELGMIPKSALGKIKSMSENTPHKCPVCTGQGKVSVPPWVGGDAEFWMSTSSELYECQACEGSGVVWEFTLGKTKAG